MGKFDSSATITPNPYAKSYDADRETFVTRKDLKRANADLAAEILKIEEMVQSIQSEAKAAMEDVQAAPSDPVRERRILELAIGMVVRDYAVPHKSKDVLADRLDAVEQTYKRLVSIVSEAK
ncbi:hypothetical protein LNAOJCKE_0387 [Methylorubrum aminovorans]|uniref:Uncharacterized protein n=1 Tax=Methylorubrum aminovorans TaxID=269069 RepID=A0ABQ4U7F8_9HYPH|nr:hypothetical protein [Methylorubrum aminovorans]GJE63193.1 hypothetical protein LNAOJCKE_0387 [Methylorubrum aminovorans]GMA79235.1 hypothetical protein GCM10025880_56520 [Methylorubrum aminovorans]